MPELRELVEMVRDQTRPVPDAWEEQQRRQRRMARNRRMGAISVSAVIAVVAAMVFVLSGSDVVDRGHETGEVAGQPRAIPSEPGIYLFDLETQQAIRIPDAVPHYWPFIAASPDRTMIAYPGTDPGGYSVVIYVANVDGTNSRALEETATSGQEPVSLAFSPDGSQIVYQAKGLGNVVGDLFLVDIATGETTRLTHLEPVISGFWDMAPTFSPNGETILFTRASGSKINHDRWWGLWSIPATGGRPSLVIRDAALARFSPDGRTIAYFESTTDSPLDGDLWLADADGSDARRLARGHILAPRWSPDGTKIAYADRGREGTYVVDLTTGDTTRVLEHAYWLEWLDGRTWIIAGRA